MEIAALVFKAAPQGLLSASSTMSPIGAFATNARRPHLSRDRTYEASAQGGERPLKTLPAHAWALPSLAHTPREHGGRTQHTSGHSTERPPNAQQSR